VQCFNGLKHKIIWQDAFTDSSEQPCALTTEFAQLLGTNELYALNKQSFITNKFLCKSVVGHIHGQ